MSALLRLTALLCISLVFQAALSTKVEPELIREALQWESIRFVENGKHFLANVSWSVGNMDAAVKCLVLTHRLAGKVSKPGSGTRFTIKEFNATYRLVPVRPSASYELHLEACLNTKCTACVAGITQNFTAIQRFESRPTQTVNVTWQIASLNSTSFNVTWWPSGSLNTTVACWSFRLSTLPGALGSENATRHSHQSLALLQNFQIVSSYSARRFRFDVAACSDTQCKDCGAYVTKHYDSSDRHQEVELSTSNANVSVIVTGVSQVDSRTVAIQWRSARTLPCVSLKLLRLADNQQDVDFSRLPRRKVHQSPYSVHNLVPRRHYSVELRGCDDAHCSDCGAPTYLNVSTEAEHTITANESETGTETHVANDELFSFVVNYGLKAPLVTSSALQADNRTVKLTIHEADESNVQHLLAGEISYQVRFGVVKSRSSKETEYKHSVQFTARNLSAPFNCSTSSNVYDNSPSATCFVASLTLPEEDKNASQTVRWRFAVRTLKHDQCSNWSAAYGLQKTAAQSDPGLSTSSVSRSSANLRNRSDVTVATATQRSGTSRIANRDLLAEFTKITSSIFNRTTDDLHNLTSNATVEQDNAVVNQFMETEPQLSHSTRLQCGELLSLILRTLAYSLFAIF